MGKISWTTAVAAAIILLMAVSGCKGRTEKPKEEPPVMMEMDAYNMQAMEDLAVTEPANIAITETIPPTAAPDIAPKPAVSAKDALSRSKDIQRALKNAGFYAGPIDGKIGPKSMKAILDFQRAKGLKVDGKVGPKTWSELEKYLIE